MGLKFDVLPFLIGTSEYSERNAFGGQAVRWVRQGNIQMEPEYDYSHDRNKVASLPVSEIPCL